MPVDEGTRSSASGGLFRTPLAAALLTGALAGGCSLWISQAVFGSLHIRLSLVERWIAYLPAFILLLSGPALCRRNWLLFWRATLWSLIVNTISMLDQILVDFSMVMPRTMWSAFLLMIVTKSCYGWLSAYVLTRLYGVKSPVALVLGSCVAIALILVWLPIRFFTQDDFYFSKEYDAILAMSILIGCVLRVSLPTLAIDAALKRRDAKSASAEELLASGTTGDQ